MEGLSKNPEKIKNFGVAYEQVPRFVLGINLLYRSFWNGAGCVVITFDGTLTKQRAKVCKNLTYLTNEPLRLLISQILLNFILWSK